MKIDKTIFQDLESFEKGKVFQNDYGKFLDCFGKILQYPKMDLNYCSIKTPYAMFLNFAIYNTKHNPSQK